FSAYCLLPTAYSSSKCELQRGVQEIDVFARAGVLDEVAGKESAVAEVCHRVAVDLPVQEQIDFRADEGFTAAACASKKTASSVEDTVVHALTPEQVVLRS